MEKIKSLNGYQKGILIFMVAMTLIFAVIYPKTIARVGYRYNDAILVPTQENGDTVYLGKIKGERTEFIVSNDNTVAFNYGDKSYGQYTMKEDPTAIPEKEELAERMKGIAIRNVDNAEPSEWEMAGRYIGWTVMTIISLVIFIIGLQ